MERVIPFGADTSGPYKQLLAAEQTAQSIQAWIEEKEDAIRTIKQQAVDQDVPFNAIDGHTKQLEQDIGRFKQLLECNEASRKQWRELHMAAWRPNARPLKVTNIPNELLTKIFANFEHDPVPQIQVDDSLFDDSLPSPDLASIKNIRLTCRAFCEVASEILLPVVDVSFTRASLQRLEEICSHPTISKSVRVVRIRANPYSSALSRDRFDFGEQTYSELCRLERGLSDDAGRIVEEVPEVARLDMTTPQIQMLESTEMELVMAMNEARQVMFTLRETMYHFDPKNSPDPYEEQISKAIDETREEYGRRCREQESLMADSDVLATIVSSVSQMTRVQRLCIPDADSYHWDHIFRSGRDNRYDAQKFAAGMTATNPFWDLMVHGGFRYDILLPPDEEPLLNLLHKLPLILQFTNENLTHLDIDLPPLGSHDMAVLTEHLLSLRHSFGSLKSVQIRVIETHFSINDPASLSMYYSLLEKILVSPRLEVVKLDQRKRGGGKVGLFQDQSIGSVLVNLPWNNLRGLCLTGFPVKVEELRKIMQKVSGKVHLELSRVLLLEGTWAETLEILRGKVDFSSRVVHPRGWDTAGMSKLEKRNWCDQFRSGHRSSWYSDQGCPGPASFYIRGGNISNPLIRDNDQQD